MQNVLVADKRRYDVAKLLGTAERDGKIICYALGLYSTTERGFTTSVDCAGG
ncbi:hypothetical protein [Scytonema sp. NUACC26]|uniref:hypothetical protein n=1 Tax=Scytonema sp. NUACC26 TaxID=3140176 RepID=UPI0038B3F509